MRHGEPALFLVPRYGGLDEVDPVERVGPLQDCLSHYLGSHHFLLGISLHSRQLTPACLIQLLIEADSVLYIFNQDRVHSVTLDRPHRFRSAIFNSSVYYSYCVLHFLQVYVGSTCLYFTAFGVTTLAGRQAAVQRHMNGPYERLVYLVGAQLLFYRSFGTRPLFETRFNY